MTKRRELSVCLHCGNGFPCNGRRQGYCSVRCALDSRIQVAGPDDCWLWTGTRNDRGYGQFSRGGVKRYAHRAVLELSVGELGALEACHHCDNPPCCNPAHLFAGNRSDNMQDMHDKGRWTDNLQRGERSYRARLTEADVLAIRAALARGEALRPMARAYGVSQGCLQDIRRGDSWKHLL